MILTVNIGNTKITIGGYADDRQLFSGKLHTDPLATADEYAIRIRSLLLLHDIQDTCQIEGCILGSVVPNVTPHILSALKMLAPVRVLTVGPGLKSGMRLRLDNPAQLGADLLCGIVAAVSRHDGPVVVINADTALSMMAANSKKELLGGSILLSPHLSLPNMVRETAQLPQIDPNTVTNPQIISTNTTACLQSGVVLGTASMIDGMAARFTKELGSDTRFFATGSIPDSILHVCATPITYDPALILDGLYAIWKRNRK